MTAALKAVSPVSCVRNDGSAWRARELPRITMSGLRSSFRIRSSLTVRSASTAVGSNPVPAIANGSTSTFISSVATSSARHAPTVASANLP